MESYGSQCSLASKHSTGKRKKSKENEESVLDLMCRAKDPVITASNRDLPQHPDLIDQTQSALNAAYNSVMSPSSNVLLKLDEILQHQPRKLATKAKAAMEKCPHNTSHHPRKRSIHRHVWSSTINSLQQHFGGKNKNTPVVLISSASHTNSDNGGSKEEVAEGVPGSSWTENTTYLEPGPITTSSPIRISSSHHHHHHHHSHDRISDIR